MENTIENLNINVKFNDNLGDAAQRLSELADSITKVNTAAGKTTALTSMSKRIGVLNNATSKINAPEVLDKVTKSSKGASKGIVGLGSSISSAIIKVAVFTRAMKTLNKFLFGGISDLNNLALGTKHMNNLFGDGADEVMKYANEVERLMGIPTSDFLSTQSTFGNMMAGFGIGVEKVKDMSQNLTQLSFDLEAFNSIGLDQKQLIGMLQSGLSGYDKSLRKLGYALREVELQEILNRNGLDVKVSQLDRAGKSQLVYMAIMEQSAKMGVFGSLAKQTTSPIVAVNILKNQFRLLAQTLAGVFLPVIMRTMKYLQALAMALSNVIVMISSLFGIKIQPLDFGIAGSVELYDYGDSIGELGDNASSTAKKMKALKEQMGGFDKLNVMKKEAPSTPSGGVGLGASPMGGLDLPMPDYGDFLGDSLEEVRELSKALEPLIIGLGILGVAFSAVKLGGLIAGMPAVETLFAKITEFLAPMIAEFGLFGAATELLGSAFSFIISPIGLAIGAIALIGLTIKELWETNEVFREKVIEAWESIKDTLFRVYDTVIKPIFDKIIDGGKAIWNDSIKPLWNSWVEAFGKIAISILDFWNKHAKPLVDWLVEKFGKQIVKLVDGVVNAFEIGFAIVSNVLGIFFDVAGTIISGIIDNFSSIIDFVKAVFTGDWEAAWEAVTEIFDTLVSSFFGIFSSVWDKITGLFTGGGELFVGIKEGISSVFSTIVNSLISGINTMIAAPFNLINNMLNTIRNTSFLGISPFKKLWGVSPIPVPKIPELPSYDVGTGNVTHDHIAQIHKGEAIIPEKFNDKKYFGKQNDEETKRLLKEQITLLNKILQKDTDVRVSSSDIESAGGQYRRMLVKAKGGV